MSLFNFGVIKHLDGTIREMAAEDTLHRLEPLLPEFGITRIANITGLDTVGIPVLTVVRPLARSLSVSQGKGVTPELATVSGIMESIEVFHAEQRRPHAGIHKLWECDRDPSFVSPHQLPIRADAHPSSEAAISWVAGENLLGGPQKWIPVELFDLDFAARKAVPLFIASSNGLASGNTRTEAIVHGLCETIERDQSTFWMAESRWLGLRRERRLSIDSIDDPVCRSLIDKCLSAGLEIFIWYISINIDIPVFACTIADRVNRTQFPQFATGYGCHPITGIALARAITEAAQSRLTHISGLREDLTWGRYQEEFSCNTDENKLLLAEMSQQPSTIDFRSLRFAPGELLDMQSILKCVLECLRRAHFRSAIVVDLATTDAYSVVFVCVPGLEYATPKALVLYTPGPRMREFVKNHKRSTATA